MPRKLKGCHPKTKRQTFWQEDSVEEKFEPKIFQFEQICVIKEAANVYWLRNEVEVADLRKYGMKWYFHVKPLG